MRMRRRKQKQKKEKRDRRQPRRIGISRKKGKEEKGSEAHQNPNDYSLPFLQKGV